LVETYGASCPSAPVSALEFSFEKMTLTRFVGLRRNLLVSGGALGLLYAVAVLAYVPFTPDIGIRCAFSPVIKRVSLPSSPEFPACGDVLRQIGNYQFPEEAKPQFWAQVQLHRQLVALRDQTDQHSDSLRWKDGRREVKVLFRRHSDSKDETIWCPLGRLPVEELIPSILWFSLKFGLFVIGALIFWKRPGDASASQFFLWTIVALGAYMGGYHWTSIATQPLLVLPFMVCVILLPAVSLHFFFVFPRPKAFFQKHPAWTGLAVYGIPTGFLGALVGSYFHLRSMRDGSPDDIAAAWNVFGVEASTYLKVAPLWYLACVVSLVHSYRTAREGRERNQVKSILFGTLLALVPIGYTLFLIFRDPDDFGAGAATWPMFAASVCFTVAFAVSITRYRLMQLDQLVSSGVMYFVISFLAGIVYYAVVWVGMLISGVIQVPSFTQALSFSATALVYLLVLDLVRGRFKKALDRIFDREKRQLDRTLRRMGEAIEQLVDPPTLARRLLQASAELLNVSRGAVYLREGETPLYRLAGCLGPAPPPLAELSSGCPLIEAFQNARAVTLRAESMAGLAQRQLQLLGGVVAYALTHENHLLAFLVLGPKDTGAYELADFELLAAFAQLTSLALESAKGHRTIEMLNRDLHEKIEKISEQQRRIRVLQSQLVKAPVLPESAALADTTLGGGTGSSAAADSDSRATAERSWGIVGSSQSMRRLLELVRKAAASPSAVLIRGESGTGKELLARALHENSPRANKPYVKVHCAALSTNLLESELFGHVKGAFTGAHRDKVGRFELANGGTLFLDEIGDISLEVQTKLLRVLQEKTYERVGSSDPVEVDVRIIAATHQDLEDLIRRERFRKDLYFRLKVIPISVPPLRERLEDIPELVQHFLRVFSERCGRGVLQVEDDVLSVLKSYSWPGNVRELENVIERAVVVAEGPVLTLVELPPELLLQRDGRETMEWLDDGAGSFITAEEPIVPLEREERNRRERERLVRALAAAGGNKAEAARALGVARSTLLSRLKKHGLS
jgi:transcriptional regulator with GAF, ATPase, and Fis domain